MQPYYPILVLKNKTLPMYKQFISLVLLISTLLFSSTTECQTTTEWRADLAYLHNRIVTDYDNLFHKVKREQFEAAVQSLDAEIPSLQRHEIIVRFAELVAMFRIGHTAARLDIWGGHGHSTSGFHQIPLLLYAFSDGWYIRQAHERYATAVGGKVLQIGGIPIVQVLEKVRPVVPFENEMGFISSAPFYLSCPEVLHAMGVIDELEAITITYEKEGKEVELTLDAEQVAYPGRYGYVTRESDWVDANHNTTAPLPLWLTKLDQKRYSHFLPDTKTLYVRHSQVRHEEEETIPQFFEKVFAFIEENDVDKLVLDVRLNGGGNNYLNKEVITGAIRSKINAPGRFFVITGRRTFSACQNLVNELEKYTDAIFVGEPTAENVNFYGDTKRETLPHSKLNVFLSWLWWQNHDPRDKRQWTAPDIAVDMSFEDYRTNHDPVLRAVLNWQPSQPVAAQIKEKVVAGENESAYQTALNYLANPQHRYAKIKLEDQLNRTGYDLMGTNQTSAAAEVFKINTLVFPNSANTYDSYGESLWKLGKIEEAITNYEKAIQLDPDGPIGQNSKAMLSKIRMN